MADALLSCFFNSGRTTEQINRMHSLTWLLLSATAHASTLTCRLVDVTHHLGRTRLLKARLTHRHYNPNNIFFILSMLEFFFLLCSNTFRMCLKFVFYQHILMRSNSKNSLKKIFMLNLEFFHTQVFPTFT